MSILVRDATAVSIKAPGDLNGYTDLSFVRRVCRIRASDITSFYLRYFQDAFQAHHKACGSTDYYFIQKAFKRGGMQISSLPPSLGNSAPMNMDEYASRSAPPTYVFFTLPGLRAVHIRMARQHNRLPADSYRIATCRLVVFCYITNKETNKSVLSRVLIMPFSALRFHVFVCSVLAVHGRL